MTRQLPPLIPLKALWASFDLKRFLFYLRKRRKKLPSLWRIFVSLPRQAARHRRRRDAVPRPPHVVIIRLTSRCNLRCTQCGQWGLRGFLTDDDCLRMRAEELDTAAWKRCIDEIAGFRPYLAFFGGEPFLRKDFLELTRYASSKGLPVWTSTNATLLAEQAEEIVESGLDYLLFSIDGPEEVNNRIRLGQEAYKRSLSGIKAVIEAKRRLRSELPQLAWLMTLVRENQACIWETSEIAWNLGVEYFSLRYPIFTTPELLEESNRIFVGEFGVQLKSCRGFVSDMSQMDVPCIAEQVTKVRAKWRHRYRPNPAGDDFDISRHFFNPRQPHGDGLCVVPWLRAQMMPNGDVVLCEDFPDLIAGNITLQDFGSIWNGPVYRKFRRLIAERGILPVCTRCCGLYEIRS